MKEQELKEMMMGYKKKCKAVKVYRQLRELNSGNR